jgi:Arc/MetJ-type ribon-helix-helix transcriptional regulator
MRHPKARLTVTVDPHLVRAGNEAVSEGRAESLSAWVNLALAERVGKERRLRALAEAIAAYEAEFGVITSEELAVQERADRGSARVVRGAASRPGKAPRTRHRGAA